MSDTRLNIGITADDRASAAISVLQTQIKTLQSQLQSLGVASANYSATANASALKVAESIQTEIAGRQQQINILREEIAIRREATAAAEAQARVAAEARARLFEMALGPDLERQIQSAAESARTLETSLSALAVTDDALRVQALETAAALEKQRLAMEGMISRAGAGGAGVTMVPTQRTIDDLMRLKEEFLSAQASAAAFEEALGAVGEGLTLTSAAGFSKLVSDLAGIKSSFLSAKESAAVFETALGSVGEGLTLTAAQGFSKMVAELAGVKASFLSAAESAKVFEEALGPVGGGLTLTASAGFSKMAADLADVKMSYLSAADSAKVFAAEGLTATERAMGMTEASVAAAAAQEKLSNSLRVTANNAGLLGRESRHVVGLFDALARGQLGQAMSSIGAGLRDAGIGAAALGTSLGGLIAFMAARHIFNSAEAMGKLATELQMGAQAAGMSVAQYSAMQNALELLGLKGTEADTSIRHLSVSLSSALGSSTSKAAEALNNLGITQAQLKANGDSVTGMLRLLAQANIETADGANKNAAMTVLLGRNWQTLLPLLNGGAQGFDALIDRGQELGVIDDSMVKSLHDVGEKAEELSIKLRVEGVQAFVAWGGEIQKAIGMLETLAGWVGTVSNAVSGLNNMLHGALGLGPLAPFKGVWGAVTDIYQGIFGAGSGGIGAPATRPDIPPMTGAQPGKRAVPPMTATGGAATNLEEMRAQMAQADLAAAQQGGTKVQMWQREQQAEIDVMQKTLAAHTLNATQEKQIEAELATKKASLLNEEESQREAAARRGASAAAKAARQSYADFAGAEKEKIAAANGSASAIIAIYDDWINQATNKYRQHVSVIEALEREKVQAVNKARLEEINQQEKVQGEIQRYQEAMAGATTRQMPAQQQIASYESQAQAIQQSENARLAELQTIISTSQQGSEVQRDAAEKVLQIVTADKEKEVELYQKASEAYKQSFAQIESVFSSIGSSFESFGNSLFKALVAPQIDIYKIGLTSIQENERSQEIKQAIGQMLMKIGDSILQGVMNIFGQIATKILAQAMQVPITAATSSFGGVMAQGLAKMFGQAAPQLASFTGQAAGAAGGIASSAPVVTAVGANATTISAAITALNASTVTGLTANATTISGALATQTATLYAPLAAAAVKPAAFGFSYAGGGIVSAQGGMIGGISTFGRSDGQMAILHPQEMVLPASISTGLQAMIARGGGPGGVNMANLNYSPTINTASRSRGGTGLTRGEFNEMLATHSAGMLGAARGMMRGGFRPALS